MARSRREWLLLTIVAVTTIQHLWWIGRHRRGIAVDADEAALLAATERFAEASPSASEVLRQLEAPTSSAPGLALLTAGLHDVFGPGPLTDLAIPVASAAVLVLATSAIGRSIGLGRGADLAAAVVATSAAVQWFARAHHQILPASAAFFVCVAVALRSDLLRGTRASVLLGGAIGVALMTRAMLVPLAPGVLLATLAVAVLTRQVDRATWRNAGLVVLVAAAIAGPWWGAHGGESVRYLAEVGGSSAKLGTSASVVERARSEAERALDSVAHSGETIQTGLLQPHDQVARLRREPARALSGVLWLGVTVAGAAGLLAAARSLHRDALLVLVVVLAGTFLVLMAVSDDFLGFSTLLAPGLVVLVVAGAQATPLRWVAVPALVAIVGLGLGRGFTADASWFSQVTRRAVPDDRALVSSSPAEWDAAWERLVPELGQVRRVHIADADLAFSPEGLRHAGGRLGTEVCIDRVPDGVDASTEALTRWAASLPEGEAILTVDQRLPAFEGQTDISPSEVRDALVASGVRPISGLDLPDERRATLWLGVGSGAGGAPCP